MITAFVWCYDAAQDITSKGGASANELTLRFCTGKANCVVLPDAYLKKHKSESAVCEYCATSSFFAQGKWA